MTQYALFHNGGFVRTMNRDERPPHIPHKNFEWYPVGPRRTGPDLDNGWVIENDQAILQVHRTLRKHIYDDPEAAVIMMNQWIDDLGPKLRGMVPVDERLSWDAKRAEAIAWYDDNTTPTPIMDEELAFTQENKADLAQKIIMKGRAYAGISGMIAGLRRATEAQLRAAQTGEEREAILQTAQKAAEVKMASLGVS